ncbi:linker histone h1 and h5 family domain-containing protein [Ditylenchus destructor]|nr:linker histone h1 and h5 family domain-containing protein [Ditylenchus destructor]
MSFINNTIGRDGILSCEQMVAKALSELGHRKGLSEIEIFQHMRRHFHYQIGTDYTQTKLDVRQVLNRGTILGTIQEVKGFGSWSIYRISEKKQKKYPPIEEIKDQHGPKRKLSSSDDSSPSPKETSSSYSLRTPVVRTPHPYLSQKSTVSHRTKEEEQGQKSVSSPGSSSHLDSIRSSKFKTPIWNKSIPEYPSAIVPASFETPLSVTSPAYIKFKKIGIQSTSTVPSVTRFHHRKIAMEHPSYEEMIERILTQLGERKALSEADIFKYLVLRFRVGSAYAKIKADLKQAIRRGVIFGTIKEVKGYGQWSTFQIAEKENDYLSAVSAKHTFHPSTASQSIFSSRR